MSLTSNEIRERFLKFFEKRKHAVIPSASLVPENDPSVLFNTAGMQPLIPYLLGKEHPAGKRLVNSQKCVRTQDIEEVGDNTHDTFFEMLGNWSLGDYFKQEAIEWSYDFLTNKEVGLGLDPQRLYVTCFEGDSTAPRDTESAEIWKGIFEKNNITGERIYFRPANKNWWSVGENGPCGPDTEMFYDLTGTLLSGLSLDEYIHADDSQKVVEVWNDVFMQYLKKDGVVVSPLSQTNVDTGSGLERVVMAVQGKTNIFDTDLFSSAITYIRENSKTTNTVSERIIADHIRTSVFIISDGVAPSNTDRGYIVRRLLRRAVRHADTLGLTDISALASIFMEQYATVYPNLFEKKDVIFETIQKEEIKFRKTLAQGLKEFERMTLINSSEKLISGQEAFLLFSTYGFPIELTIELAKEKAITIDESGFKEELKKHQELSRAGSEKKFKSVLE